MRKGIILAGGAGSRLYPATKVLSKQLLPVYDKPMIYYPLSMLMLAGLREILIISTPRDIESYKSLLEDGSQIGMNFQYAVQSSPGGIAEAFILGSTFLKGDPSALILGDNIFYGNDLPNILKEANHQPTGATIFAYHVRDPERYGVVEFDQSGNAIELEEKPAAPRSNYAVTGLYFYDDQVCNIAKELKPSRRGELEITDLNRKYLDSRMLKVFTLGRGITWLDTGTHDSLLEASCFVATTQKRQGRVVCCPEEIALQNGWILPEMLLKTINPNSDNTYDKYVLGLLEKT